MIATTDDHFLNGRVKIAQFERGFRSGLDAVMLAAAVPVRANETCLELGSGAGVASLCLAARVGGAAITGVEIDPALVELAQDNAKANGLNAKFIEADVFDLPVALKKDFDHVFVNPPFHDGDVPPDAGRARALHDGGRLADWIALAAKRTASGGTMSAITRADRLGEVLGALPQSGISVLPLWPKAGAAAKRVIVQWRKGAKHPLALLPGLVLHQTDGRYTKAADAILRDGAALELHGSAP